MAFKPAIDALEKREFLTASMDLAVPDHAVEHAESGEGLFANLNGVSEDSLADAKITLYVNGEVADVRDAASSSFELVWGNTGEYQLRAVAESSDGTVIAEASSSVVVNDLQPKSPGGDIIVDLHPVRGETEHSGEIVSTDDVGFVSDGWRVTGVFKRFGLELKPFSEGIYGAVETHENGFTYRVNENFRELFSQEELREDEFFVEMSDDDGNQSYFPILITVHGELLNDANHDGEVTPDDIDEIFRLVENAEYQRLADIDADGDVDDDDRNLLQLKLGIFAGDSDRDRVFGIEDLITAFKAGKYEKDCPATWEEGDWNYDGVFNSHDIVDAFIEGNFTG